VLVLALALGRWYKEKECGDDMEPFFRHHNGFKELAFLTAMRPGLESAI
jgi:hypothetical protein